MNQFDQFNAAVSEAKETLRVADAFMGRMANMLVGNLRKVSPWILVRLKRELQDFNSHTKRWK